MSPDESELAAVRRTVRHDLRGPIAVIMGRTDLLLAELQGPLTPAQRSSLEAILASAQRLDRMAAQLADRIDGLWRPGPDGPDGESGRGGGP